MAVTTQRVRVAEGLSIAALILLLIYGADAAIGEGETGFLPIDENARGIAFGGGAVGLSIVAFFLSLKERSNITSIILLVNGILIIIGGVIADVTLSVIGMGVIVLAMGIIKVLRRL